MPRTWSTEQALSLAPDPAAAKSGQGLASPRKWTGLAGDGDFIWGLAQGSGAQPYQVQIDLAEPAFKCSCPSRKFPCKHGLGLLLLFAAQPGTLAAGSRPEWVEEWIAKRAQKVAKQEAKAAAPATAEAPDPAAQARRREKRDGNIDQGVAFLEGWLRDLARQGLAATATAGYEFWDAPARRLVDAQAPGLARRVRELAGIGSGDERHATAIARLGRLHLLVRARTRRKSLPPEWQEEIDGQVGLPVDQEALRAQAGVVGPWFVGAQTAYEEEKLAIRVSYLFSPSGRTATFLEFSPAARPAVSTLALGRWMEGDLVFYPGVDSHRALWKAPPRDTAAGVLSCLARCDAVRALHAHNLAANPLAEATAVAVRLTPRPHGGRWWLADAQEAALPIDPAFTLGWELHACAGGQPLELVGLWNGFVFTPLTVLSAAGVQSLAARPD